MEIFRVELVLAAQRMVVSPLRGILTVSECYVNSKIKSPSIPAEAEYIVLLTHPCRYILYIR